MRLRHCGDDVLVLGAGRVGLSAGQAPTRAGLRVGVVESMELPARRSA